MKNISIIGVGKLGICFALTLEKAGYNVLGVDISPKYITTINNRTLKSSEQDVEKYLKESKDFFATTSLNNAVNHSDILFTAVETPSLSSGYYDHSQIDFLVNNLQDLGIQKQPKHLIICCTTMPQYCDSIQKRLEKYNYTVSYNPEFIAQGTILKDLSQPDMVLIGEGSKEAGDLIQEIYQKHTTNKPKFCRMSRSEAEICKISLNCFLTTKIAYANMIGDIVKKNGGRPNIVLEAIGSDSRVGNKYLRYGFGYGGPCFPRDNRALALFANDLGVAADISLATDRLNEKHLDFQVESFIEKHSNEDPIFFSGAGENIGAEIVFEGITYKKGTTIIEESQQLLFAAQIAKAGYEVVIIDLEETISKVKELYKDLFVYEVVDG
tara:strand:+ start:4114 stop:5259 length:1146 start_codon:yes stop_codon:yes gene_type:complete